MIKTINLNKKYCAGFMSQRNKIAVKDVTFEVSHNEVFGMIGLNGAGKSSVIKILMGFVHPDSGKALIAGSSPNSIFNRKSIGYLSENPNLYSNLSVLEHLQFACDTGGLSKRDSQKRIEAIIEKVGLSDVTTIPVRRYSKGMVQRAALAYSIILEPEILILDEPMSGLDPLGRQLIIDIIEEARRRGTTILFCSHILTDVERICDRIGIMHKGQLIKVILSPRLRSLPSNIQSHETSSTNLETLFLQSLKG